MKREVLKSMEREQKVQKKITFTLSEMNEIEKEMESEGFKNYRDYFVHMNRTRAMVSDAEMRRRMNLRNRCSSLYTICNQLKIGINDEENIQRLIKELDLLCQELR